MKSIIIFIHQFLNRILKFIIKIIKSVICPEITLGDILQIIIALIALHYVVLEFNKSLEKQTQNIESKINLAINPPIIGIGEVYRFDNYLSYIKLDSFDVNYTKAFLTYSLRGRKRHEYLNFNDNFIIDELPDFEYNIILKNINKIDKKAEIFITQTKKENVK